MNHSHDGVPDAVGWHLSEGVLAAYLTDSVSDAAAWSTEEHLMACAGCRSALAATTSAAGSPVPGAGAGAGGGQPDLTAVRARLLADLPAQAAVRPGSPRRRLRVLLGSAPGALRGWAGAVAIVLGSAAGLDITAVPVLPWQNGTGPAAGWVQLLAPLLPILGVACAYGAGDPAGELLASTPSGGLRLLLYRATAVLGVSVPASAAVGLTSGGVDGLAWLLPALALTTLTLALGRAVPLGVAAAVTGGVWVAVMGGPLYEGAVPPAITAPAAPAWAVVLVAAAAVVIGTRADPPHRSRRSAPPTRRTPTT